MCASKKNWFEIESIALKTLLGMNTFVLEPSNVKFASSVNESLHTRSLSSEFQAQLVCITVHHNGVTTNTSEVTVSIPSI
jgi:hypothetical protein